MRALILRFLAAGVLVNRLRDGNNVNPST